MTFQIDYVEAPTLVYFHASWSRASRRATPFIEEARQVYEGRIRVMSLDLDEARVLANELGVTCVPAIVLLASEGKQPHRYQKSRVRQGVIGRRQIADLLEAQIE